MPRVVIQHIITSWSKRTRGALGRERRARLPEAYPLPDSLVCATNKRVQHTIERGESYDYAPRVREEISDVLRFDAAPESVLTLIESGETLRVTFRGSACGAPPRKNAEALLARGSRLVVRFNGRHQQFDDPWYEDHIVHIAFGMRVWTALFREPTEQLIDRRVDLW